MSETKDDIAAERDALRAENENLRGQLAAAGANRPGLQPPAQHQFVLSEGQRQELQTFGHTLVDGRAVTAEQVRGMLGEDQAGVEIAEPAAPVQLPAEVSRTKVAGIDYIYPSVEYGKLDPAVAGTPGLGGPPSGS